MKSINLKKPYELVFIDADETLFDFGRGEEEALRETLLPLGIPFEPAVVDTYKTINAKAWAEVEAGTLDRETLKTRRFADFFAAVGVEADPVAAGEGYLDSLSRQAWLIDGAVEACASIRARAILVLLTNGITRVQKGRIGASPLRDAFDHVVISEEAGYAKPDPRVFDIAAKAAGRADKETMLMIGDSLASDIRGGLNFGIDTCWYNPRGLAAAEPRPTFVVRSLAELEAVVAGRA